MYDFHSKILSDESNVIELAKAASQAGFKQILVTPKFAYHEESVSTYEEDHRKYIEISKKLKQNNIDLEVYLANEIQYSEEIIGLLRDSKIHTINNTNYVLITFDKLHSSFYSMIHASFQLQIKGYRPIMTEIEKYEYINHDYTIVEDLYHRDVLTELDILSITGAYGKKIKKTAKALLKNNLIYTLGTNIHEPKDYKKIAKALKKIKRIVGKAKFKEITTTNAQNIINDIELLPSHALGARRNVYKHKVIQH